MGNGEDEPTRSDQSDDAGDEDLDLESEDLDVPDLLNAEGPPVGGVPEGKPVAPAIPLLPIGVGGFVVPEGANILSWDTKFIIPGVIDPESAPIHSHSEPAPYKEGGYFCWFGKCR